MVPGDQLRIDVDVLVWRGTAGRMQGKAYVNDKLAWRPSSPAGCWTASGRSPNRQLRLNLRQSLHSFDEHPCDGHRRSQCQDSRLVFHWSVLVIGAEVELGENCELASHVVIGGPSKFGSDNKIYSFAALAGDPQDITYRNEPTRLEVSDRNQIREYVTITRGTTKGGGVTRVGNDTLIMAYTHIGHDCVIGDHAMLVNAATLAGHVMVEEWAVVGALCPVHQFSCALARTLTSAEARPSRRTCFLTR